MLGTGAFSRVCVARDEAKGRTTLAQHLAFETDMSAEAAKTMLGKAEKQAEPGAAADPLSTAMATLQNPNVGADTETGGKDDAALASAAVKGYLGNRVA